MFHIEVADIFKRYEIGEQIINAVDGVSARFERGEFVSIVGHSGSGKTTFLSLIGGIIRPTSGRICFNGKDLDLLDDTALSSLRNTKIGFIFQFASLLPMLTAIENVLMPRMFSYCEDGQADRRARSYLQMLGLGDKIDSYPSQLSGGQQRRVAIARALINDPELVLADEPTGDLDQETESEILQLFTRLNREKKMTLLLITHNLELASQADRRLRMTKGMLIED